jgi:hypothetical protein
MMNREEKQERLQQLKQEAESRKQYLNNLNEFEQRHGLEFIKGQGYRIKPVEKKPDEPVVEEEETPENQEVGNGTVV